MSSGPSSSYDWGYADGWRDAHRSSRNRSGRKRTRPAKNRDVKEYALGHGHGRLDGLKHPACPEWDEAHRTGPKAELPEECPWRA